MAAQGMRPCVEIQFADYMYPAYDQITQEAARPETPLQRAIHLSTRGADADRRRYFRWPDS